MFFVRRPPKDGQLFDNSPLGRFLSRNYSAANPAMESLIRSYARGETKVPAGPFGTLGVIASPDAPPYYPLAMIGILDLDDRINDAQAYAEKHGIPLPDSPTGQQVLDIVQPHMAREGIQVKSIDGRIQQALDYAKAHSLPLIQVSGEVLLGIIERHRSLNERVQPSCA